MSRRAWRLFRAQFAGLERMLAWSLLTALAQSALLVPIALLVRDAFDHELRRGGRGLVLTCVEIFALYAANAALGLVTRHLTLASTKRAIAALRCAALERLCSLPRAVLDRRDAGTLHSVVVQDSERVDEMSNALVAQLLPALVVGTALTVALLVLDPLLTLVLIGASLPMVLLNRRLGRPVRERTRSWQRAFDRFSSQTQLLLRAMTLIKASGAQRSELERRAADVADLSDAGRRMAWLQAAYTLLQGSVGATAAVVVLAVGGSEVASGSLSLGQLVAFYALVALLRGQLGTVLFTLPQVFAGSASLERLDDLLSEPARDPYAGTRRLHLRGGFALEDVTFGYGDVPVIAGVSLAVAPGERVAVVGANGAGKSTLVSLLLGLYRPWAGRLLLDGVAIEEVDLAHARRRIGVVLEDPIVFSGTVAENISYGLPTATREQVEAAAERATARAFVEALPDGFDTLVGDEGELLSGGQRQRLALARALVRDPALLVLDEPTSHVDAASVPEILGELAALPGAPTVVIVSHDERVVAGCDRVLVVEDGGVRERPVPAVAS